MQILYLQLLRLIYQMSNWRMKLTLTFNAHCTRPGKWNKSNWPSPNLRLMWVQVDIYILCCDKNYLYVSFDNFGLVAHVFLMKLIGWRITIARTGNSQWSREIRCRIYCSARYCWILSYFGWYSKCWCRGLIRGRGNGIKPQMLNYFILTIYLLMLIVNRGMLFCRILSKKKSINLCLRNGELGMKSILVRFLSLSLQYDLLKTNVISNF